MIKRGSKGQSVEYLQWALQQLGYGLTITGEFDFITDMCVRRFQFENGLAIDGKAGNFTLQKLADALYQADIKKPETANFSYDDSILDSDEYAKRNGIPINQWYSLQKLFNALETVQEKLGVVLGYDCIYRSLEYEKAHNIISTHRTHTKACAIDCYDVSGKMSVAELGAAIMAEKSIRQLFGGIGLGARKIIHLDVYRRNSLAEPTIWWYTYKSLKAWLNAK